MFDYVSAELYPGLNQLGTKLSKYIDESGASIPLQHELDKARKNLCSVKATYFQQLLLYTQLQDILLKNNYGYTSGEASSEDTKFFRFAREILGSAQARNFINISMVTNEKQSRDHQLFGLLEKDFIEENEKKKAAHQNLQKVLIPLIEGSLKNLSLELYKLINPKSKDSEGLQLAKFNQLPTFISNEKQKLCDAQKTVDQKKKYIKNIFNDHYKNLDLSLHQLQLKMAPKTIDSQADAKQITADWLAAKCDYIILKIKVMNNHLYTETYTSETVEALMKVRSALEEEIAKTNDKIQKTKSELLMYESVGIFNQLLNEFSNLTMEIDNKKWALTELQKNKHK